ncbi:MAG: SpoIIIAH-like family protein [Oscillospiraceae bacterium]|nr:SpoIIIAH-like family protein [Oscillospiraceae bacterium]
MKKWKKNMVALAVLFAVCAGIYVNWLYSENENVVSLADTLDADKVLSSDTLVMSGDTVDLSVSGDTLSEYFSAVRLSRQEARDSAVTLLQEAMAYTDSPEAAQSNVQLEEIVQTALCEAQIESLVIAKGYADCVAYITDESISVAVAAPEGGLLETDVAVIADIILTQSEFEMDDIYVVEVQ